MLSLIFSISFPYQIIQYSDAHTELFKKSPLYSLPCEWNKLDDNRYISNRTTFKTAIKYSRLHSLIDDLNA
jgi:hypothetical protein